MFCNVVQRVCVGSVCTVCSCSATVCTLTVCNMHLVRGQTTPAALSAWKNCSAWLQLVLIPTFPDLDCSGQNWIQRNNFANISVNRVFLIRFGLLPQTGLYPKLKHVSLMPEAFYKASISQHYPGHWVLGHSFKVHTVEGTNSESGSSMF